MLCTKEASKTWLWQMNNQQSNTTDSLWVSVSFNSANISENVSEAFPVEHFITFSLTLTTITEGDLLPEAETKRGGSQGLGKCWGSRVTGLGCIPQFCHLLVGDLEQSLNPFDTPSSSNIDNWIYSLPSSLGKVLYFKSVPWVLCFYTRVTQQPTKIGFQI